MIRWHGIFLVSAKLEGAQPPTSKYRGGGAQVPPAPPISQPLASGYHCFIISVLHCNNKIVNTGARNSDLIVRCYKDG